MGYNETPEKGKPMFGNRSINLKMVKDKTSAKEATDPIDIAINIATARAYSAIGQNFVSSVAVTVVSATVTIVLVKTACELLKTAANKLL